MTRHLKTLVTALLLCLSVQMQAAPVQVKARLDSVRLLMGRLTALHLEVVEDAGTKGSFPLLAAPRPDGIVGLCGDSVELRTSISRDTVSLGSGRIQINYTVPVQSFDSGEYRLPPFVYVAGRDTARSNELMLQVIPVPVNEDAKISDYAGVAEPADKSIFDILPQWMVDFWWVILLILLLAALTVWGIIRYRDRGYILPKKPEPSPYKVAKHQLAQLRAQRLWERGLEKDYFTRLTDVLRIYLDKRFGINAMEMTSDQIVRTLADNPSVKEKRDYIRKILTTADFVKFAKVRPQPGDSVSALEDAERFVEETKPSEEEEQARLEAEKAHQAALLEMRRRKASRRSGKRGKTRKASAAEADSSGKANEKGGAK